MKGFLSLAALVGLVLAVSGAVVWAADSAVKVESGSAAPAAATTPSSSAKQLDPGKESVESLDKLLGQLNLTDEQKAAIAAKFRAEFKPKLKDLNDKLSLLFREADGEAEALDKALGQLDLSDDQKAAIAKIRAEFEPKIKDFKGKLMNIGSQMSEAEHEGDLEKAGELWKQFLALGNPLGDMIAAITKEIKPDQFAKLKEMLTPPPPARKRILAALKNADELELTDDQKTALNAMFDKLLAIQRPRRGAEAPGSDAMVKMQDEQKQHNAEFDKILNKDQLAQLQDIMAKKPPQMRGRGGPVRPGGANDAPPTSGGPNPAPSPPGGPAGGN